VYCPNCSRELQREVSGCVHCGADFTSPGGWRLVTKASPPESTSAIRLPVSTKIVRAGAFIAAIFPAVFLLLAGFSSLISGCTIGGSGRPAFGCKVLGISFNWLITFATPAFVFSFFTVPLGLLVCLVGAFWPDRSS
jgi:hypothetical protein